MMRVAILDVDGHNFPNLALMKIARWHRMRGDSVEHYTPLFGHYDRVYMAKVFTHTPPYPYAIANAKEIVKGGTGYDIKSALPGEIDHVQPDYSVYPFVDRHTAYGFLTRGCCNRCPWCIVPLKEGRIRPYMDVDEIAIEGRTNLILMDNNVLACGFGLHQLEKIAARGYRVDFNQGLDARLVTTDVARLLASVKWTRYLRFGCDTAKQVQECERAMQLVDSFSLKPREYLLYTMIYGDIEECYSRIGHWRGSRFHGRVKCQSQPMLDFSRAHQDIARWQIDMARWSNRKEIYSTVDFKDYRPRKHFACGEYFSTLLRAKD